MKTFLTLSLLFTVISCGVQNSAKQHVLPQKQRPLAYLSGKFFDQNGDRMLYGGDSTEHFNVSNSSLDEKQFHYGIGREAFPALLHPEFTSIAAVDTIWDDSTRFLVAFKGNDIKAYSIKDLTRHEVINDELDGHPIMAAYCILADLGAVYSRKYNEDTLTFALSGYTYFDPEVWNGLDGFVLWDRETESLWWPLVGKAVSGTLKEVTLNELDTAHWRDLTWGELKRDFPAAKVLISGQDFERPTQWTNTVDTLSIQSTYIR